MSGLWNLNDPLEAGRKAKSILLTFGSQLSRTKREDYEQIILFAKVEADRLKKEFDKRDVNEFAKFMQQPTEEEKASDNNLGLGGTESTAVTSGTQSPIKRGQWFD